MKLEIINNKIRVYPDFFIGKTEAFLTVNVNCCQEKILEVSRAYTHKIVFPSNYVGSPTMNSITINNITLALTATITSDLAVVTQTLNNWLWTNFTTDTGAEFKIESNNLVLYLKNIFHPVLVGATFANIAYTPDIIDLKSYVYDYTIVQNGIYTFELRYKDAQGNIQLDKACILVDTDLTCLIADHIIKYPNSDVHLIYQTIANGISCNCVCDDLCILYKQLVIELKLEDKCKTC